MNARQKAKHYKKLLLDLWEDYVKTAEMTNNIFEAAQKRIWDIRSKEVTCVESVTLDTPMPIEDCQATDLMLKLMLNNTFRQAVTFEGHTDLDTGKYILEAKLTVVMPEVEE